MNSWFAKKPLYPCVEQTLEFDYKGFNIRIWRGTEFGAHDKDIDCKPIKKLFDTWLYIDAAALIQAIIDLKTIENINAIQVRVSIQRDGITETHGKMVYTVPF